MCCHTLNLLLKDIEKMNFVQPTLLDANHAAVKFIQEHQFTHALFCTRSAVDVVDQHFDAWITKQKGFMVLANQCINLVNFVSFWSRVQKIIDVVKPLVKLLRIVDTNKFVMGKVYWVMSKAIKTF